MFGRALGVGALVVGGGGVGRLPVADRLVGVLLEVVPRGAAGREGGPHEPRVLERVLLAAGVEHGLALEAHDGLAREAGAGPGARARRRRRLHARARRRGRQRAVLVAAAAALRRIVVRSVSAAAPSARSTHTERTQAD